MTTPMIRTPAAFIALVAGAAALTALLVTAPATAQPAADASEMDDAGPEISPVGSFFSRYEARRHYGPQTDFVRYRARLGVDIEGFPLWGDAQLNVRFVPQSSGFWQAGGDTLGDAGLDLHEGFFELDHNGMDAQVGRFEMAYGDQLLIGPVGWHHAGRAFDGARLQLSFEGGADLDLFATLVQEGFVDGTAGDEIGAGDLWFFGAYWMLGEAIAEDFDLDLYALARVLPRQTAADVDSAYEGTLGARVKGGAGAIDYRLEGGVQVGSHPSTPDQDTLAYSVDGEAGYTCDCSGHNVRLGLLGFYATGDDPETDDNEAWSHLYPTAHKFLGLMDVIGPRSNIMGGGLLVSGVIAEDLKGYANAYQFIRPEDSAAMPSGTAGTELNLGARLALGPTVGLRGGYGAFLPSDDFGDDTLHFLEIELRANLP